MERLGGVEKGDMGFGACVCACRFVHICVFKMSVSTFKYSAVKETAQCSMVKKRTRSTSESKFLSS